MEGVPHTVTPGFAAHHDLHQTNHQTHTIPTRDLYRVVTEGQNIQTNTHSCGNTRIHIYNRTHMRRDESLAENISMLSE